jgi:putative lipoic acid-binding regulatory protein
VIQATPLTHGIAVILLAFAVIIALSAADTGTYIGRGCSKCNPPTHPCCGSNFLSIPPHAIYVSVSPQVNKYPGQRTFSAIGTGGDDFKASMLAAVETVVGPVHVECVSQRPSSNGKYVSIRIGPVWVQNSDQVTCLHVANFSFICRTTNGRSMQELRWFGIISLLCS